MLFRVWLQMMFSMDGLERGLGRSHVVEDDEGVGFVGQKLNILDNSERRENLEKFFVGSSSHESGVASENKLKNVKCFGAFQRF